MSDNLAGKSVEELRKLARGLGLSGYSKMRKDELVRLLLSEKIPPAPTRQKTRKPAASPKPSGKKPERTAAGPTKQPAPAAPRPRSTTGEFAEQQIESSKYALVSPDQPPFGQHFAKDISENPDYLPTPSEAIICLLPQKPGIMQAYWSLAAPLPAALSELRLRLGRRMNDGVEIVEEIPLPSERGHWYFHVPESDSSGDYYLHLGSYRDGSFVTAIRRGIVRVPQLFASADIDRRWWIDEERFREMYLRAGGVLRQGRLAWPGSASSPGGAGDSSVFSRHVNPGRR